MDFKKIRKVLVLILFVFFVFQQGNFSGNPLRIISLAPVLTDELYLLNVPDKLIGCTVYCKAEDRIERVGTVMEVNLEKIMSLKPDYVLASNLTDVNAVKKLAEVGVNVVVFPLAKNYEELCGNFLKLGKIAEREKEAKEIISDSKKKVDLLKTKVRGTRKTSVFVQLGSKPLFALTGDMFGNDFIEFANGINITKGLKSGLYSREELLKNDPCVILISDMGITGEEEKKEWEKYSMLQAVKNKKIFIIDSYALCSPTPVTFPETLKFIAELLHPEIKTLNPKLKKTTPPIPSFLKRGQGELKSK
ncbi:MAG: helical backbone metal receptor [bacterium]